MQQLNRPLRAVQAETAKVNGQEPYTWLRHVMERLPHPVIGGVNGSHSLKHLIDPNISGPSARMICLSHP
jgi:hypothetical protein